MTFVARLSPAKNADRQPYWGQREDTAALGGVWRGVRRLAG
jgi:hypothetical protein